MNQIDEKCVVERSGILQIDSPNHSFRDSNCCTEDTMTLGGIGGDRVALLAQDHSTATGRFCSLTLYIETIKFQSLRTGKGACDTHIKATLKTWRWTSVLILGAAFPMQVIG